MDRNQHGPHEKYLKYFYTSPKQTSVFLHKLFRFGAGGGPMECGEVGCTQNREPGGPKIHPSKARSKKHTKSNMKIFYTK